MGRPCAMAFMASENGERVLAASKTGKRMFLYRQFRFEKSEHSNLNECVPLFRHATQYQPGAPHAGTF